MSNSPALPPPQDGDEPRGVDDLLSRYVDELNEIGFIDPQQVLAAHPDLGPAVLENLKAYIQLRSDGNEARPLGTLGDYTLRRQIGRGGMGVVYEAWQNSMDRQVALKVMPKAIAVDTKAVARFIQEAQLAGKLSHPNIVHVHGMGVEQQIPYYAMDFVEGETLAQIVSRLKDLEPEAETPFGHKDGAGYFESLARAFADVADGLQHAHSKKITHRDIKPSNLILDREGRLRILDFGLARLEGQEGLTISGDVVGTPQYMSPEQARRRKIPVDYRTDIYSLGATLYEMLTLEPPFRGKDHADTLSQIIERDPPRPGGINPRVPRNLETIVLKCLRKEPGDRYGTAEAMGQELRRFVRGDAIEARPEGAADKLGRWLRRNRKALLAASLLAVIAVFSLAVAVVVVTRAYGLAAQERDRRSQELYVSDMRLAMSEWESGNFQPLGEILERHRPVAQETDRRSWEWNYLDSLRRLPLRTLAVDPGGANAVAWSPDGKTIASGGADGKVRLWAADEGKLEKSLQIGPAPVRAVAWSPDTQFVAGVGQDGTVRCWHAENAGELFEETADRKFPDSWLGAVAWSPNGIWLASAVGDGTVHVRDGKSGQLLQVLSVDADDCVPCLAWSPDNQRLAACLRWGRNGSVVLWETTDWRETGRFTVPGGNFYCVSWHPDGNTLATASAMGWISLWDATTFQYQQRAYEHEGHAYWVAWSPDGTRLASAGQEGVVRVWDRRGPNLSLTVLRGHESLLRSVAWSPDGKRLASASLDGTVKVWDAAVDRSGEDLSGHSAAAWSPDGRWLATYVGEAGAIRIRDEETRNVLASIRCLEPVHLQNFSPDGTLLAVAEARDTLCMREWRAGRELARVESRHGDLWCLAWSPDGRWLASGGRDGKLRIWKSAALTLERDLAAHSPEAGGLGSVAWSPDGLHLATTGDDLILKLWDTRSWQVMKELQRVQSPPMYGHGTGHQTLSWSPDSHRLATCISNAHTGLVVFDVPTGRELFRAVGHVSGVAIVAWSPDGRRLATGGFDHRVKVWDAQRFEELVALKGHTTWVYGLAWSPDGRRLLTEAGLGVAEVKIWDAGRAAQ